MPVAPTYPGVYIEEVPSGVRTITGVPTSITAFVGRARRGSTEEPVRVKSFAEFERKFGGLWDKSTMSYAVHHFFLNGGADAIIVRLINGGAKAGFTLTAEAGPDDLLLEASSEGTWGDNLRVTVDHKTRDLQADEADKVFNLFVAEVDPDTGKPRVTETHRNVSVDADAPRYVGKVLERESALLRVPDPYPGTAPSVRPAEIDATAPLSPATPGDDGSDLTYNEYEASQAAKKGIYALEKADIFNLLCLPPFTPKTPVANTTWQAAATYCEKRRALLIVDAHPDWKDVSAAITGLGTLSLPSANAAIFFPRPKMRNPEKDNALEEFAPCGVVAGVIARTDSQRGVWKAPAGIDATLRGVRELSVKLTDGDNGDLNPLGVNCLRTFPVVGHVVWGARTMRGADKLADQWKYIPVRRLALYIEETLYRGTQWVVFEPNDEPLWSQIRLNVGAFMHRLFRQGAFQGTSPREAYFVKCDKETTPQADIDLGIVNIIVGFAPLKPAEFVIIKIQQIAGQVEA